MEQNSVTHDERVKKAKLMKVFIAFAAGMAGLLFGLDIGVISGALPFITTHFDLSSRLQEWVVSTMMLGAALGAISTGWISFKLGRKKSLMAGATLFVLGSLGSACAPNVIVLLVSRVLLGFAVGIASYVAPLYLSEMSEKEDRGKLISMYQMMVTIGILVAFRYYLQLWRTLAFDAGCYKYPRIITYDFSVWPSRQPKMACIKRYDI